MVHNTVWNSSDNLLSFLLTYYDHIYVRPKLTQTHKRCSVNKKSQVLWDLARPVACCRVLVRGLMCSTHCSMYCSSAGSAGITNARCSLDLSAFFCCGVCSSSRCLSVCLSSLSFCERFLTEHTSHNIHDDGKSCLDYMVYWTVLMSISVDLGQTGNQWTRHTENSSHVTSSLFTKQ